MTDTPSLLPNPEFGLALKLRHYDILTLNDVFDELTEARAAHGNMASHHEALSVIHEEFLEYRNEVYTKHRDRRKLRAELVQLAAMAVRAIADLEDDPA